MSVHVDDVLKMVGSDAFADYVSFARKQKSALLASGVAATDPVIAEMCKNSAGGWFINLPFFKELGADSGFEGTPLTGSESVTPAKPEGDYDVAAICRRIKAFASHDLAAMLSGADPMQEIADGLIGWMDKADRTRLLKSLEGALGAATGLVKDYTSESAVFDADMLLDAAQLLGENKSELVAYAMNSATETHLQKLEGTDLFKPSELPGGLKVYNGRAVIIDDMIPAGTVYLFGRGAVAYDECAPAPGQQVYESYRDALKSTSGIVIRPCNIIHPRGIRYKGEKNPTNEKLGTAGNWEQVYATKDVRIACLKANLTA